MPGGKGDGTVVVAEACTPTGMVIAMTIHDGKKPILGVMGNNDHLRR